MLLCTTSSVTHRLLLFVASMGFHCHPSIAVVAMKTVAYPGISNPQCEFPVARKARTVGCGRGSTCGKLVVYSKGHKGGTTLKSWLMKRDCLNPQKLATRYDNLTLPCNTCGTVPNPLRIFQGISRAIQGAAPKSMFPDEQEQLVVLMCVCCERLCNAEEGFNLSHFQPDENMGIQSSRSIQHRLIIVLGLHYIL